MVADDAKLQVEAKQVRDEAYRLFKAMLDRHSRSAVFAGMVAGIGDVCDEHGPQAAMMFAQDLLRGVNIPAVSQQQSRIIRPH